MVGPSSEHMHPYYEIRAGEEAGAEPTYWVRDEEVQFLWQKVPALKSLYLSVENECTHCAELGRLTGVYWQVPYIAIALYLAMIAFVPRLMAGRTMRLKGPLAAWNLFLAVFSAWGALRTVPHLAYNLSTQTWADTLCKDPSVDWNVGPTGLWVALFVYSKVFELVDTVFLVLRGREVSFLHWYHHVTVMTYCWHSYTKAHGSGLWFVAMNYTVHAIMYAYYAATALRIPFPLPSWSITVGQISQMIVGTVVCIGSYHYATKPGYNCSNDVGTQVAASLMYGSYFLLFVDFAVRRFILKKRSPAGAAPARVPPADAVKKVD